MPRLDDLGLYAFSSLIQADAAIIGLLAILLIYLLQQLENEYQSTINVIESLNDGGLSIDLRRLIFLTNLAEIHYLIDKHKHRKTQLEIIAFTKNWKKSLVRDLRPVFVILVIHIIVCCVCLYHATVNTPVYFIPQDYRLILSLVLFPIIVVWNGILFYLTLHEGVRKPIPAVPTIRILALNYETLKKLFPSDTNAMYLYDVEEGPNLYVRLRTIGGDNYRIWFFLKSPEGELQVIHRLDLTDVDRMAAFFTYLATPTFRANVRDHSQTSQTPEH